MPDPTVERVEVDATTSSRATRPDPEVGLEANARRGESLLGRKLEFERGTLPPAVAAGGGKERDHGTGAQCGSAEVHYGRKEGPRRIKKP
jgi:hypothetical protein